MWWYFLYLHFLSSGNLGLLFVVLILDINLLLSFLKFCSLTVIYCKCFCFYPSENPVNGRSLHWVQPQCAEAYDKLTSMVESQTIICFLILDCNKYSQVGSALANCFFFCELKLEENYFYSTVRLEETNIFLSRILRRFHKFQ